MTEEVKMKKAILISGVIIGAVAASADAAYDYVSAPEAPFKMPERLRRSRAAH